MILVTGGSGYIGSHTLLELKKAGHEVVVYDDLARGHAPAVRGLPLVQGNLADQDLLVQTMRSHSIDTVMHFAARCYVGESVSDPGMYIRDNSFGMYHLLEAMREARVNRFVFSSTCAVYGVPERVPITEDTVRRPISPYGFTKRFCEEMLEAYAEAHDLAVVALRYFNAAGSDPEGRIGEWHEPETHLIPHILRTLLAGGEARLKVFGDDYPTPDGTCVRDYIHVADLAQAHRLALEHLKPGTFEPFNLGTGRGHSVLEVIQAAINVTGKDIPYDVEGRRSGDPPELVAAPAKAQGVLGFAARYPGIQEIVQHAWNWLKAHPHGYADGPQT